MAYIESHRKLFRVVWREDGNRRLKAFTTRTEAEYFKLHVERTLAARARKNLAGGERLSDALELWLSSLPISPATRHSYEKSIIPPFFRFIGDVSIYSLNSLDFGRYLVQRRPRVKSSTLGKEYATLKRFLDWATAHFALESNPVDNVTRIKAVKKSPGVCLSYEQDEAIIGACNEYQRLKVLFARDCGMRARNLGLLTARSIDMNARSVTFNILKKREDDPENAERRTVPLTRRLYESLRKVDFSDSHKPIFGHGKRVMFVQQFVHDILWEKVGFRFRWHDLRHTFFTRFLEATDNIAMAEWALGHSMTYWHPSPEKIAEGFRKFDEANEAGIAAVRAKNLKIVGGN